MKFCPFGLWLPISVFGKVSAVRIIRTAKSNNRSSISNSFFPFDIHYSLTPRDGLIPREPGMAGAAFDIRYSLLFFPSTFNKSYFMINRRLRRAALTVQKSYLPHSVPN